MSVTHVMPNYDDIDIVRWYLSLIRQLQLKQQNIVQHSNISSSAVDGIITLNDIISKPATTHGQDEVKIL